MKKMTIVFIAFFAVGCAGRPFVNMYSRIDTSDKTVFAPLGERGLTGQLKRVLREKGWNVYVSNRGDSVTTGLPNQNSYSTSSTPTARYRLLLGYRRVGTEADEINLDLSFVDVKTGQEVFTMNSNYTTTEAVVEDFSKALDSSNLGQSNQ